MGGGDDAGVGLEGKEEQREGEGGGSGKGEKRDTDSGDARRVEMRTWRRVIGCDWKCWDNWRGHGALWLKWDEGQGALSQISPA